MQAQSILTISDVKGLPNALKLARGNSPWSETTRVPLKEEHVTVIKKSPIKSLTLEMRNSPREGNLSGILDYTNPSGLTLDSSTYPFQTATSAVPAPAPFNPFWDNQTATIKESVWINFGGPNSKINLMPLQSEFGWAAGVPIYEIGDTLIITVTGAIPEEVMRVKVTNRDRLFGGYEVSILSHSETITSTDQQFDVTLEQPDPMFELSLIHI